jgi:GH24 family phage-related lysozyme (muramidase)
MTQLSPRGAHFISRYEGWRDKPYDDSANHATIGFGHLIHMAPVTPHDLTEWGTITVADGIKLLQSDAGVAEAAIDHYITRALAQCERDALASFAFNCGGGALNGHVGQAVNVHQDPTTALAAWNRDATGVEPGLVKRRAAEALLFMTGDYGDGEPPLPPKASAATTKKQPKPAPLPADVPSPVPDWAWLWVEWKLGRANYKGHAGDPDLRESTGAPATVPPWAWTFLKRF